MIAPGKLAALRKHLGRGDTSAAETRLQRVQKNLSIPAADAARLKALSQRDGISQAGLLIAALDAYETLHGKLE